MVIFEQKEFEAGFCFYPRLASFCSSGWPWIHSDPALAHRVLGLQVGTTSESPLFLEYWIWRRETSSAEVPPLWRGLGSLTLSSKHGPVPFFYKGAKQSTTEYKIQLLVCCMRRNILQPFSYVLRKYFTADFCEQTLSSLKEEISVKKGLYKLVQTKKTFFSLLFYGR